MKQLKQIITSLALLIAALVLIFGPRPDAPPVEGRVVVHYWEKWSGTEGQQMQEIVDWFNDTVGKEKGIYVQYLSLSGVSQKTLVATAAGVPPDLAGMWDNQVPQFAAADALMPLDALAREHGITEGHYKKVYWDGCHYRGKLYALISSPSTVALLYNKEYFLQRADRLRAAGLDPDRAPRTLEELDRYAIALDDVTKRPDGSAEIRSLGYVPVEPGWWIYWTGVWFGTTTYDAAADRIQIDNPKMVEALRWIQSYAARLGNSAKAISEFRSGFGSYNSTQNAFLVGQVAMVQQGPWLSNIMEDLTPSWNRWRVPESQLKTEKAFADVRQGMSLAEVKSRLGEPASTRRNGSVMLCTWDAGIKTVTIAFANDVVKDTSAALLPAAVRRQYCQWGAAPFPSAVPGLDNVTVCAFNTLVIPKGSKHPKEAFEFIAFVNRQDVMEKLCSSHCTNSPLTKVSPEFIENHPNAYIKVFDDLAFSPNTHAVPSVAVWAEISDETSNAAWHSYLMLAEPHDALQQAQQRAAKAYEHFKKIQVRRRTAAPPDAQEFP